jgi:hypothetical protein
MAWTNARAALLEAVSLLVHGLEGGVAKVEQQGGVSKGGVAEVEQQGGVSKGGVAEVEQQGGVSKGGAASSSGARSERSERASRNACADGGRKESVGSDPSMAALSTGAGVTRCAP